LLTTPVAVCGSVDFRPAFRSLGWFRERFPEVPVLACTATATPHVVKDILTTLKIKSCRIGSFDRKNIYYRVAYKDTLDAFSPRGAVGHLTDFISKCHRKAEKNLQQCSGIVYVHKREDTQMLAAAISKVTGVRAAAYHGGLKKADRTRVQDLWVSGEIKVAIATIAFGMGVDLAHVRYVIHWSLAKSVEAFYQESGRAGRDGQPAQSLLYYAKQDASKFEFLARQRKSRKDTDNDKSVDRALDALGKMVDYAITPHCRREYLLRHFGEKETHPKKVCAGTCDFCNNPSKVKDNISRAMGSMNSVFKVASGAPLFNASSDRFALAEESPDEKVTKVGDLCVTSCDDFEGSWSPVAKPSRKRPDHFRSASETLAKYEVSCITSNR